MSCQERACFCHDTLQPLNPVAVLPFLGTDALSGGATPRFYYSTTKPVLKESD